MAFEWIKDNYHKSFSVDEIKDIRESYINGTKQSVLANRYNTTIKTIYNIVNLITYKYIDIDEDYKEKLEIRRTKRIR